MKNTSRKFVSIKRKLMKTKKENIFSGIVHQKCPNCGEGYVFEKGSMLQLPKMKEECDQCHYRYYREPGYFLGAMYISYGLSVFQGILTFLFCYFFLSQLPTLYVVFAIIGVIFLLSMKNYKYSRVIYMYIFPN